MQIPISRRGGGGPTIETSTFTITESQPNISFLLYSTIDENGKIISKEFGSQRGFENTFICLRNTPVVLITTEMEFYDTEGCDSTQIHLSYDTISKTMVVLFPKEETASVRVWTFEGQ